MQRDHAILCVLSTLKPELACRTTVYTDSDGESYSGTQSNEAAVKYLLEKSNATGWPITEIDYLWSKKTQEALIDEDRLPDGFPSKGRQQAYSSEDFFIGRIEQFCNDRSIPAPSFNPIEYDPENPSFSLSTLIAFFNKNDFRISIDITGGPRDAAILLTLAIEVLKLRSKRNELGPIVYAYYDSDSQSGKIVKQDFTFSLIDLVHAVEAFTNYGRADKLQDFFSDETAISPEARKLCSRMADFSNALEVCQISDIEKRIIDIHENLDIFSSSTEMHITKTESLQEVSKNENLTDDIRQSIVDQLKEHRVVRGEMLFASLVPTIKDEFIPVGEDKSDTILNTIRWCANHQMVQQGLCIFRERIIEVLLGMNYLELTQEPPYHTFINRKGSETVEPESKSIKEMLNRCFINASGISPNPDFHYFAVNDCPSFRLAFLYYSYLRVTRNRIMHIDIKDNSLPYKIACKHFGLEQNGPIIVEETRRMLLSAIDEISTRNTIGEQEWRSLFDNNTSWQGNKRKHARY